MNRPTEITLRATDDTDTFLSFNIERFPDNGILSDETIPSNGLERIFKYTPRFDFVGTDLFTFSVTDSSGVKSTNEGQVNIEVVNPN